MDLGLDPLMLATELNEASQIRVAPNLINDGFIPKL